MNWFKQVVVINKQFSSMSHILSTQHWCVDHGHGGGSTANILYHTLHIDSLRIWFCSELNVMLLSLSLSLSNPAACVSLFLLLHRDPQVYGGAFSVFDWLPMDYSLIMGSWTLWG